MSMQRIKVVVGAAAYVAALHWAYVTILAPLYGYEGFRYRNEPAVIALTWALPLVPTLWMPLRLTRPSQLAYWLLYVLIVAPVAMVTIHSYPGSAQTGIGVVLIILAGFAALGLIYTFPLCFVPRYRLPQHYLWAAVLMLSAALYSIVLSSFQIHFELVPLSDVYHVRSQYENTLAHTAALVSYAVDWQALVLNPMLIVLGLISRRVSLVVLGVFGQLLTYSFTGFRTVLFSSIFLGFLLVLSRSRVRFGVRLLASSAMAVATATALYVWSGSLLLAGLVIERLAGLPGLLTGFYFSFFSTHPKMMLSHSIFGTFIHNPYSTEPPILIGQVYLPSWGAYANANFWADAFANFGVAGVFAFTALLGIVFWFYDSITVESDLRFAALVLALPALSLANGGLLTCLFTHGIAFASVLMYCFPGEINKPVRKDFLAVQHFPRRPGVAAYPPGYSTGPQHK